MAISDDGKRGQIGPSLRGLIYQYERDGVWVTSKWPKKRGKKATSKQKLAQEAFKQSMLAMKLTAPAIQLFHRIAAKGTPMLPRDSLMAALYGNGPPIHTYSGKVIKPMANRILSSTVLDALGSDPGTIMYRGPELWEVLPPGLDGQVLAYAEAEKRPVWIVPPEGGGGPKVVFCPSTRYGSGLFNVAGNLFCFSEEQSLKSMTWNVELYDGYDQRVGVATLGDDNKIDAILYPQRVVATTSGEFEQLTHQFDAPVTIPAKKRFFVWVQYNEWYGPVATGLKWAGSYSSNIMMFREPAYHRAQIGTPELGYEIEWRDDDIFAISLEMT